jgi:putative FmdB family regulatory protein
MPIYEYKCGSCGRKVSLFFPSIAAAESRTAAGENRCPHCESANLTKLMSRARTLRHATSAYAGNVATGDLPEEFGGDEDDFGMGNMGLPDDDDPRTVARWARQMKEQMGPEMDLGPEFDRALERIEAGEDPDRVMDDMDPATMGGDDEEIDDLDFSEDSE